MYFELKQDELQDGEGDVDSREKARRTKAAKTKIFVKLYFNGREVGHQS